MDFKATGWFGPACLFLTLYGLGSVLVDISRLLGGL